MANSSQISKASWCALRGAQRACVTQYASCWWYMPTHLGLCSGMSAFCRKDCAPHTRMQSVTRFGAKCLAKRQNV